MLEGKGMLWFRGLPVYEIEELQLILGELRPLVLRASGVIRFLPRNVFNVDCEKGCWASGCQGYLNGVVRTVVVVIHRKLYSKNGCCVLPNPNN